MQHQIGLNVWVYSTRLPSLQESPCVLRPASYVAVFAAFHVSRIPKWGVNDWTSMA